MSTELDALAIQAGQVDGETAATSPEAVMQEQEQAAALGLAEQNAQAVQLMFGLAVPILGKMYPSLIEIYTAEAVAGIAGTVGPLAAKYGKDLHQMGGQYKEEIATFFVCAPIAWATVEAVKADIAARSTRSAAPAAVQHSAAPAVAAPASMPQPGSTAWREPAAVLG